MTKFTIACLLLFVSGGCYSYMMATKDRKKENIAFVLSMFFCFEYILLLLWLLFDIIKNVYNS